MAAGAASELESNFPPFQQDTLANEILLVAFLALV